MLSIGPIIVAVIVGGYILTFLFQLCFPHVTLWSMMRHRRKNSAQIPDPFVGHTSAAPTEATSPPFVSRRFSLNSVAAASRAPTPADTTGETDVIQPLEQTTTNGVTPWMSTLLVPHELEGTGLGRDDGAHTDLVPLPSLVLPLLRGVLPDQQERRIPAAAEHLIEVVERSEHGHSSPALIQEHDDGDSLLPPEYQSAWGGAITEHVQY
ncbi:hypothetical protein CVT24_000913 [Panaeolus cyanescens]|uniref:Uncharacterized protein n=1 Tax=Panaeolus cyanescens TaxID=181874 RepID=A0A409YYD0_9AGAR|nr:hypothetical protein CVT24_000913 [Panaeolus cyanescens]